VIRLSKSGIEYLDYVWNFYSGCLNWKNGVCPLGNDCWAKKITKRFPAHYPNGFEPTYYPEAFLSPLSLKMPSIIGCAFMGDQFGDWVDPEKKIEALMPSGRASVSMSLKGWIYTTIQQCPQHTFLFLTKCPQNYNRWSPFPDNAWPGVTVTSDGAMTMALQCLSQIEAKVKYLSLEPLLGFISMKSHDLRGIADWLIIGACTGNYEEMLHLSNRAYDRIKIYGNRWTLQPKIEWVKELVEAANKAGIKVFLKDNLQPILPEEIPFYDVCDEDPMMTPRLRQEMPNDDTASIQPIEIKELGG
jgi:protein gp37